MQRPSWASMFPLDSSTEVSGDSSRLTPPASAMSHSPLRSDCTARCTAISEDEQAVSTASAGPCQSSMKASRPAVTLNALPVL